MKTSSDAPMNSKGLWINYHDRMERVTDFILKNLDKDLDLMVLADIACLSPYHWHRVYAGMKGETITQTVKRLRLQRAGHDLISTELSVEDIGKRYGYPNLQSFTRIFASHFDMPPGEYRRRGYHTVYDIPSSERDAKMYDVETKTIEAMTLAGLPHKGSYMEIGGKFEQAVGLAIGQGAIKDMVAMIGIYYDDPGAVALDELRSFAGAVIEKGQSVEAPLEIANIDAGKYAVLTHKGPYGELSKAYTWFYGTWMAESGLEFADAPPFEKYLNSPHDTAPADLITEIHVPLKS
jgi:AraC family transcriptional regulator